MNGSSHTSLSIVTTQLYLTDLSTRDSLLLCRRETPILQLSLQDDNIWVASTDSSIERWPAEGRSPQKVFQKGGSFLAGNLSFSRARVSLEGSNPVNYVNFLFIVQFHLMFVLFDYYCYYFGACFGKSDLISKSCIVSI